jgi:hypothetical protein
MLLVMTKQDGSILPYEQIDQLTLSDDANDVSVVRLGLFHEQTRTVHRHCSIIPNNWSNHNTTLTDLVHQNVVDVLEQTTSLNLYIKAIGVAVFTTVHHRYTILTRL